MKQIIITTADRWLDGNGFETEGHVLAREVIETAKPITCDDVECLNEEEFGEIPENADYMIRVYIYNSEEDEAEHKPFDETNYWLRGC